MQFVAKLKLANQLRMSFGLIIGLLLIVSIFSFFGLSTAQKGIEDYRALARATNLASSLQANLLVIRLSVIKYLNDNANSQLLSDVEEKIRVENDILLKAKQLITDPSRSELVNKSDKLITEYEKSFYQVIELINQRHALVDNTLDPVGKSIRVMITALIDQNHKDNIALLYQLAKLQESFLLGRLFVTKFLVTNAAEDAKRAHLELNINVPKVISKIRLITNTSAFDPKLDELMKLNSQYENALQSIEQTIIDRNNIINSKLNVIGPDVTQLLEQVKTSIKAEQDTLGPVVEATANEMEFLVQLVSIIALILGVMFAVYLPILIRKPIGGEPTEIALITARIAKGDLTQKFDQYQATGIYQSVSTMSESLKKIIASIVDNGSLITQAAQKSNDMAQATNDSVNDQRERTSQIATAINEMSYSISEVVKLSSGSATAASEAKIAADDGLVVIDNTASAINHLAKTIERAMTDIDKLAKCSSEIGAVVEVIRKISEQTNLLALNAAIEAARAGEQGRGFSVVADEVRNLAKRTQESTNEIQTMIEALQSGTNAAVQSMANSSQEAINSVQLSAQTRSSLTDILAMISTINDMNNQVAVAVEEQSSVCEDINQNITGIAHASERSADSAAHTANSSQEITDLSKKLQIIVQGFKLS